MRNKYLVVVYPPTALPGVQQQSGSYAVALPPSVKWVTASSAKEAASDAEVKPGGYALVADEEVVERFARPKQADLVRQRANGSTIMPGQALAESTT